MIDKYNLHEPLIIVWRGVGLLEKSPAFNCIISPSNHFAAAVVRKSRGDILVGVVCVFLEVKTYK